MLVLPLPPASFPFLQPSKVSVASLPRWAEESTQMIHLIDSHASGHGNLSQGEQERLLPDDNEVTLRILPCSSCCRPLACLRPPFV